MTNGGGFWGSTPTSAAAGDIIDVEIHDPAQAGQTVTVQVDRSAGQPAGDIEITLDENGDGKKAYTVPSGPASIEFTSDGQPSHVLTVTQGPE
jgi:hypothetical protein